MRGAAMVVLAGMAMPAAAQSWSTRVPDSRIAGAPSQVMVLASPHLGELAPALPAAALKPLLDRLATWRPDAIAIEGLSGEQCDQLRRFPSRYGDTAKQYCPDTADAGKATGLDVPAATAEVDRLLDAWPATPSSAQRRRLAAVMLAAGEPASAMVQWLRLAPAERKPEGALDAPLVARLDRGLTRANESYQVAAALAAGLGQERVWPVDDHTSDAVTANEGVEFEAAMRKVWSGPALDKRMADIKRATEAAAGPGGALSLYRFYNAPEQAQVAFDSDFGAALRDPSPEHYGRRYSGWWETRNMRMVANIRAVLARRPGMKLLAVVGASHKPYYEAYLAPMHDVRIADVRPLLR